jgi:hydroxymethylpyrimidine kinase/phosphomethylpyrimidine kinase
MLSVGIELRKPLLILYESPPLQRYYYSDNNEVMVSTSGSHLLPEDAIKIMREQLLPLATILTPNVPEAMLLLSDAGIHAEAPTSVDDLVNIAKTVQSLGPEFVLLKGGHLPLQSNGIMASIESEKEMVVDVLYGAGAFIRIDSVYQESKNTHGTGCSLACEFRHPSIYIRGII